MCIRDRLDRVNGAINADLDYLKYKQALERQTRSESSDGFNTGTSAAVSYTHLDVYKRQPMFTHSNQIELLIESDKN